MRRRRGPQRKQKLKSRSFVYDQTKTLEKLNLILGVPEMTRIQAL
jgi:hypothetical protein